jgi:hypothetical protein
LTVEDLIIVFEYEGVIYRVELLFVDNILTRIWVQTNGASVRVIQHHGVEESVRVRVPKMIPWVLKLDLLSPRNLDDVINDILDGIESALHDAVVIHMGFETVYP